MDDWTYVMYFTMRTFHPQVWIFYIIVIFFCGFFAFNMIIAVLKTHYSETAYIHEERKLLKRKEKKKRKYK